LLVTEGRGEFRQVKTILSSFRFSYEKKAERGKQEMFEGKTCFLTGVEDAAANLEAAARTPGYLR